MRAAASTPPLGPYSVENVHEKMATRDRPWFRVPNWRGYRRRRSPEIGWHQPTAKVDIEIAKAALSGCVVAVIGAVLTALIKAREQSVQAAKLRAEILDRTIQQLGEIYRSVKATRRNLRSWGLPSYYEKPPTILSADQLEAYKTGMNSIEKAQLSLEGLKIQAINLPPFANMKNVGEYLGNMEDYLRVLLRESEEELPNIATEDGVKFEKLTHLNEFTSSTTKESPIPKERKKSDYRFKTHFANAYDEILKAISRNLKDLAGAYKGMHPTANSVALMRETWMNSVMNARRRMAGVRR